MKRLKDILPRNFSFELIGKEDIPVSGLSLDSRKAGKDFLFAALPGTAADGHQYIPTAIEKGARSIICQHVPGEAAEGVSYIVTPEPAKLLALVAANFYDKPTEKLDLIGVTGTNGKTTITTLLYQLFRKMGFKCGLISTPGIWINEHKLEATHTTPDTITLNSLLHDMMEEDCDFVFMEVSSHSVVQDRVYGLNFRGGIFTNLTHDHLDYHKTFENYRNAKKAFFDMLDNEAFALTNADDKNGRFMLQNTKAVRATYGLQNPADFKGKIVEYDEHGMLIDIDGKEIYVHLLGRFNAYNLLAVYAAARLMDISSEKLFTLLSSLHPAEGRFSTIHGKGITAIVDYAHTPDALQNVLETIREINLQGNKVITVVGCGGNRDKEKRPVMARIAAELSSQLIITSDNPRNEDPETIIHEMEAGVPYARRRETLSITDRKQAIKTAVAMARKGDFILVAGKGHEKYQEIKGVKHPFDDTAILEEMLKEPAI